MNKEKVESEVTISGEEEICIKDLIPVNSNVSSPDKSGKGKVPNSKFNIGCISFSLQETYIQ